MAHFCSVVKYFLFYKINITRFFFLFALQNIKGYVRMCVSSSYYLSYFRKPPTFHCNQHKVRISKRMQLENNKLGPRFYVNYIRLIASHRVEVTRYLPEYSFAVYFDIKKTQKNKNKMILTILHRFKFYLRQK